MNNKEYTEVPKDLVIGRNAVLELLKSGRTVDSIYIQKGERQGSVTAIIAKANQKGINIKEADAKKLQFMCGGTNHQGIIARVAAKEYSTLDDVLELAKEKGEEPFIILCDELSDPHNLGAVLRTAECCGAHGVVILKHRSVGLTHTVAKASAGAIEYVPVIKVTNMASFTDKLKDLGFWIYCADMDGQDWCTVDYSGKVALIIGAEGKGISRLLKDKSDVSVSVPIKGNIESLNVSVACGIISYEIARQRSGIKSV